MVMSLRMALGHKMNFLRETPEHAKRLLLDSPILFESHIRHIEEQRLFEVERIDITYSREGAEQVPEELSEEGLLTSRIPGTESLLLFAVRILQRKVVQAVKKGAVILVLSDKLISNGRRAIPSLLAVSASFKALQRERLVNRASLIWNQERREISIIWPVLSPHHNHPYLAFRPLRHCDNRVVFIEQAALNYVKAASGLRCSSWAFPPELILCCSVVDSVCLNQDLSRVLGNTSYNRF
jgi:glutamate synthase (NADPH/NADH) large chain